MKKFLTPQKGPQPRFKSTWRRLWNKSRRTIIRLSTSTFLFMTKLLVLISSRRFKFIMTWIQSYKCSHKSFKCWHTFVWFHNINFFGSSSGMSPMCLGRPRISPSKDFQTNNLTSGSTRPLSNTRYHLFLSLACFVVVMSLVVNPFNCFMQLKVEALKLYAIIVTNLSFHVQDFLEVISLESYILEWWEIIWEICSFREFKPRDNVQKNKSWE